MEPPREGRVRPATLLALVLALGAAVSFILGPIRQAVDRLTFGFPAYYTASRLVVEGRWTPAVYENDWFHAASAAEAAGIEEIYRPNPPTMSLIALPLAGLDVTAARRMWLILEVLAVGALIGVLLAALPSLRAPPAALGLVALVLAWSPLHEDIRLGQAYTFIALLQALVVLGVVRGSGAVSGLALGVSIVTKVASVPAALVLGVRGHVRALAWAAAAIGASVLLTLPFAGLDGWRRFVEVFIADTVHPGAYLAVPAYQSTTGLLTHLLVRDAAWNPAPVIDAPGVAVVMGLVLTVGDLATTVALARRGPEVIVVGLALATGLLVINLAQEYHGAMLLPVAAIAMATWRTGRASAGRTIWLIAALVLAGGPFLYRDVAPSGGWIDVLWYPRLAGAWLLWGWLAREIAASPTAPDVQRATAETRKMRPSRSAA